MNLVVDREICAAWNLGYVVNSKDVYLAYQNSNVFKGGDKMRSSIKDEVAGKVHEVKGKVKEKAGQLTNDPDSEAEGQDEKIGGKVQKKIGQVEKVLGA